MHRYVHHERSGSGNHWSTCLFSYPPSLRVPLLSFERNFSIIRWNVHLIDQSSPRREPWVFFLLFLLFSSSSSLLFVWIFLRVSSCWYTRYSCYGWNVARRCEACLDISGGTFDDINDKTRGFRYILLDQIEFRAAQIGQSGATWGTLGLNSSVPVFLLQNCFSLSFFF